MNARFHECSLTTGEGICLNFVCWLSRPPRFLPLMGSALCPGPYWPRLAAPAWHGPPAEPCTRQGKDKEKRISFRKDLLSTTFHLHFRYRKKYQGPKRHCFQTLDVFPPKRRKPFPNLEIIFKKNKRKHWRRLIGEANLQHFTGAISVAEADINGVEGACPGCIPEATGAPQETHTCAYVLWIRLSRPVRLISGCTPTEQLFK